LTWLDPRPDHKRAFCCSKMRARIITHLTAHLALYLLFVSFSLWEGLSLSFTCCVLDHLRQFLSTSEREIQSEVKAAYNGGVGGGTSSHM
jgi:hypothetical protein